MKIAIGFEIIKGSWGGGNQFANSLCKELIAKGHSITNSLRDDDIDIILLTDPRYFNKGVAFGSLDILFYLIFRNKNAIVIHRINECDQRKNTKHMNRFLRWSNFCADHTVFISNWLKSLNLYQKYKPSSVILNGADNIVFNNSKNITWKGKEPLKIVTHHWSPNKMKGFDVYKKLDELSLTDYWKGKIEFTYIGNLPNGFNFKNAKVIKPLSGKKLGDNLASHHVYITASNNEPAGMHHIEGALSGLPIIYKNSGALPEYCKNYGVCFNDLEFVPALKEMMSNYYLYKSSLSNYPNNASIMSENYLDLFNNLLKNKDEIIGKRKILKSPILIIKNFIFLLIYIVKYFRRITLKIKKNYWVKYVSKN